MELTRAERAARDLRHHEIIADEYERVVNEPRTLGNDALFRKVFSLLSKQRRQMLDIGGWELFPRFGGNLMDRIAIPLLDLFTRKRGVVGMFVVEAA